MDVTDEQDINDILNYSGSTESYSIPSDQDTDDTVDYRDKDDDEGNDIIMAHKFYYITFQAKRLVETHRIFQSKVNVMQNYLVCC